MAALARCAAIFSRLPFVSRSYQGLRRFAVWIALPSLLVAGIASGEPCPGCNTTGVWSLPGNDPPFNGANWGYQQVHLALLRGGMVNNVNYHSYLISWAETGPENIKNGLYGWKPGDPGYSAYPGDDHLKFLHQLPDPGVNLFCAGHSTLADGRLLVSGGHVGHDVGIVAARIFDPVTRTWQTPPDTMHYARWYATNTTLPSGQVLTTSGSRFFRSLTFGGSMDLGDASESTDDMRPGQLSYPAIVWEEPVTPPGQPNQWPAPREGHTAAWLGKYNRMIVFGGRGTNGFYRRDTWALEYGQSPEGPYVISGEQVADGPDDLYGHVAAANYDGTFMLVHGGKNQAGAVKDQISYFQPDSAPAWMELTQVSTLPNTPPGKRWGHAATWDNQNQRMIVFGGRGESGLADNDVYTVTVDAVSGVATWMKITPSGGPSAREGHTLVWDSVRRERPEESNKGGEWDRAIVFGGQDAGETKKKDAWILWWSATDKDAMEWQAIPDGPAALLPRTRHASFWDLGGERFIVLGGDTGDETSAADVWELRVTATGVPALEWAQVGDHTPGLAGHTIVRVHSEIAAQPERFDPQTGHYTDDLDNGPDIQPRTQAAYPPMFVLPSGNLLWPAPNTWTQILNMSTGQWSNIGGNHSFFGEAAVMYKPGKVMKAGGSAVANGTAILELGSDDATSGWQTGKELSGPNRHHHNLTILPDGKVLLTGGGSLKPELWDPDELPNEWWIGDLAENHVERDYHATVLVLPDARVLTAGGIDSRVTIFSPPYLFDAQGNWAPRPAILNAPCAVAYGSSTTFEVRTSDIAGMAAGGKVALLRPSSVTHAFDMDQRYVPLNFTVCGDRLQIEAPESANIAPPGEYLLFLVNGSGVPSVAEWIRVGGAPLANCDAALPSQASAPVPEIISETEIWLYWSGAANDAPETGTVAAYEVRRSGQEIGDEEAFCAAPVAAGQAVPASPLEPPTGYQYWQVTGLTPNTLYHLALKARDESWNWGPVSESVSATTLPSCCGGGGGYSARRAGGDGLLRADAPGAESRPDAPPAEGALADATSAGDDRDLGTVSADPMGLVSRTGEPLAVEMRLQGGRPIWTIAHLDAAAAEGLSGSDGATIILQTPGANGVWETRARFHPATGSGRFGLRSAERPRRFVFLGPVGLEMAGRTVEAAAGGVWRLTEARHSQLGDVTSAVEATGGYDLGLLPGETLTLAYEPEAASEGPVTDCFVFVSPSGTAAGLANRGRIRTVEAAKLPASFALHQNQPNPFARTTTIRFDLATESEVRLALFDAQGRRVRTLATGRKPAGFHALEWDRRDDAGREVEAGVYLYRLEAGAFRAQRKVVLLP